MNKSLALRTSANMATAFHSLYFRGPSHFSWEKLNLTVFYF